MMEAIELELRSNNLYRNGRLLAFPGDGEVTLVRDRIETVGSLEDDYYVVKVGDEIDQIAWEKYSGIIEDASKYWWIIADANNIYNPFELEHLIGTEILVPNILNILLKIS